MIDPYSMIFFDAGGTLFKAHPSIGEIYSRVAARYGTEAGASEIETVFQRLWHDRDGMSGLVSYSDEKKEKEWWYGFVRDVFAPFGGVRGYDDFFKELHDLFGSAECWRLFPEVTGVLESLAGAGKRLAIVSNWDRRLTGICEGLQIRPYFEFILASAEFGAAKPSPRIFQEALRQSGVPPEQAVHIGDSLEDDVGGAARAGIASILVDRNRRRDRGPGSFEGVRVISHLEELLNGGIQAGGNQLT